MDSSRSTQSRMVSAPSWCAEMQQIIDFEVLAEQLGVTPSEAFRMALDEYIALQEYERSNN